jgi:hypothetical protein
MIIAAIEVTITITLPTLKPYEIGVATITKLRSQPYTGTAYESCHML